MSYETTIELTSIRSGIVGSVMDFVKVSGFHAELDLVVDLVYELADYREEDVPHFPSVYLTHRTKDSDPLKMIAPGADRIPIGESKDLDSLSTVILKNCAGLADQGWSIFVTVTNGLITYGIFRSEQLPISVSSSELLSDPEADIGSALLLRNCAKNCVELTTGTGAKMEFALTSKKPTTFPVSQSFDLLAASITQDIHSDQRSKAKSYFQRLLTQLTQQCHGTIVVVLPSSVSKLPVGFTDGVVLREPIDLFAAFVELQNKEDATVMAGVTSREVVLRGMIESDGVTVLSADGKVLAFRVFVKANEIERQQLEKIDIRGGARSRAFELLKLRLDDSITCVFFRSQDGKTECLVKNDE